MHSWPWRACSKDKDIDPPAELTEFTATLKVQRAWDAGVGGEKDPLRLGLALAVVGERVYAAGRDGDVAAFEVATGKPALALARESAPGGRPRCRRCTWWPSARATGRSIAFNASDGAVRWTVPVGGEVLTAPAVGANIVVVRTVDGRLRGLSPQDGHELWFYEQSPCRRCRCAARRGPSSSATWCSAGSTTARSWPSMPRMAASFGKPPWRRRTAAPSSSSSWTSIPRWWSRAANVYVVGFQGRVAMLALDSGQVWWSHDASSYRGLGMDDESLYYSTAAGEVVALRKRTGAELWRQEVLKNRGLSAPDDARQCRRGRGFRGIRALAR